MKEVFSPAHGVPVDAPHVIGAVSIIFWALMLVVTLKYIILILRADNRGEGGIMALTALAAQTAGTDTRRRHMLLLLGVFGAALFYGDSVITPAISVLGAVEGLTLIASDFSGLILPVSVTILVALFMMQRHGTAAVSKLFSPIIVLWFGALAVAGIVQIIAVPQILIALNPLYGIEFLIDRGPMMFAAFGTIVLVLTGAEALYADMGHFGKVPIRLAWTGFVLPALALNYMGQGAVLMQDPQALAHPFYHLFSADWLIPAVVLATLASVIASQAVISGAYSMTRQAMQLGFLPRLQVHYTSDTETGQIYMPQVNRVLLVMVLLAMLGFGSSAALAAAYGIAVTGTMLITTLLTYFVVRHAWAIPRPLAVGATAVFLVIDVVLVASCMLKFFDGGWFPVLLAMSIFTLMATWKRGRALLIAHITHDDPALLPFIEALTRDLSLPRIARTAVYTTSSQDTVPQAFLHNLKHNRVLHEQNIILTVQFDDVPRVPPDGQLRVEPLASGFWRVQVRYGFMDKPDIPAALARCQDHGLEVNAFETSYFLSRETVVPIAGEGVGMAPWRGRLFGTMSRNAGNVVEFFQLPDNAVIELGTRVQI
jgi:KUP system potassium uptake protein